MKISQEQLKKIIKEELAKQLQEDDVSEQQVDEIFGKLGSAAKNLGSKLANKLSPGSIARNIMARNHGTSATPQAAASATPQAAASPIKFTPPVEDATGEPAQKPTAAPKDAVADSTSDIVLPHAIVIKNLLVKQMGQSLQKTLGGLSQDQRKAVMGPVMQYLNNLPNMASKVVAEAMTPDQIKALKVKHAGNVSLINKNLQGLEGEIMNGIKSQLNTGNTPNMLFQAIDKTHGNSKEGLQYMKSLQKNPQGHLDALLANAQLVLKNVMSILQKNMPSEQGQLKLGAPQQPGANAAAMAKKQAKPAAPAQPVAESYNKIYNKWQKIIKG